MKTEDLLDELFNRVIDNIRDMTNEDIQAVLDTMRFLKTTDPYLERTNIPYV